jgi:lysophospholipase L1-like esterase
MLESRFARPALALFAFVALACGRTPTGPVTPTPPPVQTYSVAVVAFADDNNDGVQNAGEPGVVPDAEIDIGGHTGTTAEGTGAVTISGIPAGTYPIVFSKLPPFYQAGAAKTITVPQTGGPLLVPATLPIAGDTHPDLFLSFGDSISQGDPGSSDKHGYQTPLRAKLMAAFLRGSIQYRGGKGLASDTGSSTIKGYMKALKPAYVLIDWGVNDWNPQPSYNCQADPAPPCPLIDNLKTIVDTVRNLHGLPVLATLTPPRTTDNPSQRIAWTLAANDLIRALAKSDSALLADIGDAFNKSGHPDDLLSDEVHPNNAGYALMADTLFAAITTGTVSGTSFDAPVLLPLSRPPTVRFSHPRR